MIKKLYTPGKDETRLGELAGYCTEDYCVYGVVLEKVYTEDETQLTIQMNHRIFKRTLKRAGISIHT